jgi:hypothetical protein
VCAQVGHDAAIATSFFATLPFVVGTATFFTKIQTRVVQDAYGAPAADFRGEAQYKMPVMVFAAGQLRSTTAAAGR